MPRLASLRSSIQHRTVALTMLAIALLSPVIAFAADEVVNPDARLEGYKENVFLNEGGVGGPIIFLILLIAITMGVMFINAKRSHLD